VLGGDNRAEIIAVSSCPADWVGKTHAIWRAVSDSRAAGQSEVLLFLDADTALHRSCIRACAAIMKRRGLDFLSLLSTLTAEKWFERLVQPAAAMELLRQYPITRANSDTDRRPFANGQFIMVRRESYRAYGGHESIHGEVLEDVKLSRQAAAKGQRLGLLVAGEMLHCRMYRDYAEFRRGWLRIYSESTHRRPRRLRGFAWRLRLVGSFLPTAGMACAALAAVFVLTGEADVPVWIIGCFGLATYVFWLIVIGWCYRLSRVPAWCAPAYPIGAWMASNVMARAARDLMAGRPTKWGGREYQREVR